MAVGRLGMGVQITLEIPQLHEQGQFSGLRRLDFAAVLAQLRWDPGEADRTIYRLLGVAGYPALAREHAILADLELPLLGTAADLDIVCLRSGKVLKGGAEGLHSYHPQIHLQTAL